MNARCVSEQKIKSLLIVIGLIIFTVLINGCAGQTTDVSSKLATQPLDQTTTDTPKPALSDTPTTKQPTATSKSMSAPSATTEVKLPTATHKPTNSPTSEPPALAAPSSPTPIPLGNPPAAPIPTVSAPRNCTLYPMPPGDCPDGDNWGRDVWHCSNTYFNSRDTIAYSRPDWMGELPDDLLLSELSIPGTHDTMALRGGFFDWKLAITQRLSLERQLDAGIRFLDIRVRTENFEILGLTGDDQWRIYHGVVPQNVDFYAVLRGVVEFLDAHPNETVLMNIQAYDNYDNGEHNGRMFEMYMDMNYKGKKFREWVWHGDSETGFDVPPRLGDVRGKIVIFENAWFPYEGPRRYGLNASILKGEVGWQMQASDCNKTIGEFLGFDQKFEQIKKAITNSMLDPNLWYGAGLNGAGHLYPIDAANGVVIWAAWCHGMNERTYEYITSCYKGDQCAPYILDKGEHGRLGIIQMDFPGAGLIDAIIAHNGLPRLVVSRAGPFPDIDGWGDAKHYATIHSADINGDGVEDQLGRANTGMEAWGFKADSRSWMRGASNGPFRDDEGWGDAKHYATIHSGDFDGDGKDELLGRAALGIEVWRFDVSWLVWEEVASGGPFRDDEGWGDAKHYATIHSADIDGDGKDELLGRGWDGMIVFRYNTASNRWDMVASGGPFRDDEGYDDAKYYATIHSADIDGDGVDELLGRGWDGMYVFRYNTASNRWDMVASGGPFRDDEGWGDAKHYATIHSADVNGDGRDDLLGRAHTGMEAWGFNAASNSWEEVASGGPFRDDEGWGDAKHYATIHSADIDGDGKDELLGRAALGIEVWRFDFSWLDWELVCTVR